MRKRPLPVNAEVAIRVQVQPLLLNGGQTVRALSATFAVTRAGRRRIVRRAGHRRIVRDLILAIAVAVGMVVAFEILMRMGWL